MSATEGHAGSEQTLTASRELAKLAEKLTTISQKKK